MDFFALILGNVQSYYSPRGFHIVICSVRALVGR